MCPLVSYWFSQMKLATSCYSKKQDNQLELFIFVMTLLIEESCRSRSLSFKGFQVAQQKNTCAVHITKHLSWEIGRLHV